MLPTSLRNTHPHYRKGQPTETLPVNRQKASYGSKVEETIRKEIEEEMKKTYEPKEVVHYSEPIEVKTTAPSKNGRSTTPETTNGNRITTTVLQRNEEIEAIRKMRPIEVKTKQRPARMEEAPPPKQPMATELLQQSYNDMKKLKQ